MPTETAALTDMEILNLPDAADSEVPSDAPETPETAATIETQAEEVSEETQLGPEQAKPETLAQPKPQDKTQQTNKPQQPAKDGTPEQAQEIIAAKAAELDRADQAFQTGDTAGMAQTIGEMFEGNPGGCAEALWVGLRYLEQTSPEHLSNFSRMVVSDQLASQGAWDGLQMMYDSALKSGDKQTAALIDQFAGGLREIYGIGPRTPEAQAAEMSTYTRNVGQLMDKDVPAAIVRAFGPRFSAVQPQMQEELLTAVRLELRDRLMQDKTVTGALQKLSKAYSAKEGTRIYFDVIEPRVRSLVGMIVPNLANQYADVFKNERVQTMTRPAQRPAQQTPAKPKSMAEYGAEGKTLGDITREVLGELDESNPLGSDEARGMSDLDILSSNRVSKARPKWQPGNELDEAQP